MANWRQVAQWALYVDAISTWAATSSFASSLACSLPSKPHESFTSIYPDEKTDDSQRVWGHDSILCHYRRLDPSRPRRRLPFLAQDTDLVASMESPVYHYTFCTGDIIPLEFVPRYCQGVFPGPLDASS